MTKPVSVRASPEVWVGLLRGINVGGNKKVPMAELRELAAGLGWAAVKTCIQSGNLVFRAEGEPAALAAALEQAIERRFGFPVPVIVRSGAEWLQCAASPGFAEAAAARPHLLHLAWSRLPPRPTPGGDLAQQLQPYCTAGERVVVRGGAIWIDFQGGAGRSQLTPRVLDRVVGSPVTARNWNTVQAIAALLEA